MALAYNPSDNYGVAPPVSNAQSIGLSLFKPFKESQFAVNEFDAWAFGTPLDEQMKQSIDLMNYQIGNAQQQNYSLTTSLSGMAGQVLDPVSLVVGGVGGKIAGAGIKGILSVLPDAVSGFSSGAITRESTQALLDSKLPYSAAGQNKFARFLPDTFHDMVSTSTESAGAFAGFTLPQSFQENYDADTNRLNYGGLIKSITINGGIGFALPPAAYLAGIIGAKVLPAGEKVLSKDEKLAAAKQGLEKGDITQEHHDWYENYLNNPEKMDEHHVGAINILAKDNHPINAMTGSVDFPFMTSDEMQKMQTFSVDAMASGTTPDYKTALTDYVAHGMVDRWTEHMSANPESLDGWKGAIEESRRKLANKEEALKVADERIEKSMPREKERAQPITQQRIYGMMKKGNLSAKEMPFIVPEHIERTLNKEAEIKALERKAKDYQKEFDKTGRTKFKKLRDKTEAKRLEKVKDLSDYVAKEGRIRTQAEELEEIKSKLIGNKLPEKYQLTREYMRLVDLARVSSKARGLLERVRLRDQYELQEAYTDVLEGIHQMATANLTNLANPERVINYMKERIESALDIKGTEKYMSDKVKEINDAAKLSALEKTTDIKEADKLINESEIVPRGTKDEFNAIKAKLEQFKGAEKELADLVSCMGGTL